MNTISISGNASRSPAARLATRIAGVATRTISLLERWVTPVFDLGIRIYVGQAFFKSGLTKIVDWNVTLGLFENVYHVPVLPPAIAAVMGTAGELALPLLLIPGIAGRFAAAGLTVVNVMAVVSYFDELSELGLADHLLWGVLLLVILLHGPGRLSVDRWLKGRLPAA